jgi:hypothetical protein
VGVTRTLEVADANVRILLATMTFVALLVVLLVHDGYIGPSLMEPAPDPLPGDPTIAP